MTGQHEEPIGGGRAASPPTADGAREGCAPGLPAAAKALGKGLATTARALTQRAHTRQYPHLEPDLPDRSRGVIALLADNCTSCMLCARECPDWCIYIDSHKETLTPADVTNEGGRARQHNVLDRFDIDFSLCMYCGICIEVCPFDALFWAPDFAYADGDIRNLLHDKDRLGTWMATVPESALPESARSYEQPEERAKPEQQADQPEQPGEGE